MDYPMVILTSNNNEIIGAHASEWPIEMVSDESEYYYNTVEALSLDVKKGIFEGIDHVHVIEVCDLDVAWELSEWVNDQESINTDSAVEYVKNQRQ